MGQVMLKSLSTVDRHLVSMSRIHVQIQRAPGGLSCGRLLSLNITNVGSDCGWVLDVVKTIIIVILLLIINSKNNRSNNTNNSDIKRNKNTNISKVFYPETPSRPTITLPPGSFNSSMRRVQGTLHGILGYLLKTNLNPQTGYTLGGPPTLQ